jgi:hypothetical protein
MADVAGSQVEPEMEDNSPVTYTQTTTVPINNWV